MSVVAASLMFLSQTETYSSMNYRMMSQARYGAESGIQKATNYLLNTYTSPAHRRGRSDRQLRHHDVAGDLTGYNGTAGRAVGEPRPSRQTIPARRADRVCAGAGTLAPARRPSLSSRTATLLRCSRSTSTAAAHQTFRPGSDPDGIHYGGATRASRGTATLDTESPAADVCGVRHRPGCGALTFRGNGAQTDSYDSRRARRRRPGISNSGGNVGTNGNLDRKRQRDITGLSTPRVGIGVAAPATSTRCRQAAPP